MRNCGICGINLVDGHKICLDCFGKLVEEESMVARTKPWLPGNSASAQYYSYVKGCTNCWPFDCGCL